MTQTIGIILVIVAVAMLVVGTLYLLGSKQLYTQQTLQPKPPSDDIASIEQDLQATDLSSLDTELADIEAQLGQ